MYSILLRKGVEKGYLLCLRVEKGHDDRVPSLGWMRWTFED